MRRIATASTLALAALIVLYLLLFTGGGRYKVTAAFENASQLVRGNQVDVAGAK
jgi:ABC-type transporter Mla subunit MlaD